jgi:tetratricopeptide (TPR) repeat protein
MPQDNNQELEKAKIFFQRAYKVARTENFDYAIDMFLEGIRCAPNEVQNGHIPLRELALLRQQKGGKPPSMVEKVKRMRNKSPLDQMINCEYLLSKDPLHLPYAEALLKASVEGSYHDTVKWIADLIFLANNNASKPSFHTYKLLKDSYSKIGLFDRAIAALHRAVKLKPEDGELSDEFKRLEAERTVSRGGYDKDSDFRHSIKNRESQEKLHAQSGVVRTDNVRVNAVQDARSAYKEAPELEKNIFKLAQALSDLESDFSDEEAIKILENAYKGTKNFSFMERAGKIRIKQAKRKLRKANKILEENPEDTQANEEAARLCGEVNRIELQHYGLCVDNYPTDLHSAYEYGVRLMRDKQYDKAIPLLQNARRDPRHKIPAMSKIGLCFFDKGWYEDAIDVLKQAADSYEVHDDGVGKDLRYNLARAYEEKGDKADALEIYRKIAQIDFSYRDVTQRVDNLRKDG